ncbi:DNA polymerase III subunit delta [Taylorella equigenitalis]|uniref:DNA polymerase III subunit delta n=1 Tax=Taylorella equigenitalis ATCC 35865 TaxID=743973 RepID=A0ABM5N9X4_9BURK|nr:DNA polymerase III subunit delta [Taylorella equigenitalis]AFN35669.1 putative DNA polymerase III, delta subunit [Taylorella equigenitalis ATCC 35865]ASY39090.1 DNA polymerase III subunit delta [Taylorella equigenitalis]WDU46911.1 DNA polymerase III subunit delta [Taylorella equigenitalis]WDU52377.1 DNA polymerase III subunit delta [Taylorella equigenitalis]WDU55377.1 DNA polymerase III subunit delta [Taylorella equigenitalis]
MYYDSLDKHIKESKNGPERFYLITGDEILLSIDATDKLRAFCRNHEYSERISMVMDSNSPWDDVLNHLQSNSLFSEKKILEISVPTGKFGKKGGPTLAKLAEYIDTHKPDDICVILSIPKLDKKTQQTKWYVGIKSIATLIEIPNLKRQDLPAWARKLIKANNQTIEDEALMLLIDKIEGNIVAAQQEINKLALVAGKGANLTLETVRASVADSARYDIFQLTESILLGNVSRSLKILQGLKQEGSVIPQLLPMITREIRILYKLVQAQVGGKSINSVLNELRIFSSFHQRYMQALSRLNLPKIMGLLQHATDIDQISKGYAVDGRLADSWLEMERLVFKAAGNGLL